MTPAPAFATAVAFSLTGLILATVHHYESGNVFAALLIAPLAALFAYGRARSAVTLNMLRRTRAELARAAVAEERLRIARDLHDLLGHSLSLITLKAELAGRVISTDPDRAAREIAELESVARQSLADVRGAVAGFRQPDLAGELVAARQLLDAAGIAAKITSADTAGPAAGGRLGARLGRPGGRHQRCQALDGDSGRHHGEHQPGRGDRGDQDNGPAAAGRCRSAARYRSRRGGADSRAWTGELPWASRARPFAGSGLAGLAERVRGLGGELAAGVPSSRTVSCSGLSSRSAARLGARQWTGDSADHDCRGSDDGPPGAGRAAGARAGHRGRGAGRGRRRGARDGPQAPARTSRCWTSRCPDRTASRWPGS